MIVIDERYDKLHVKFLNCVETLIDLFAMHSELYTWYSELEY